MILILGIVNAIFFMYILSFFVALSWAWYLWRPTFSARALFFWPVNLANSGKQRLIKILANDLLVNPVCRLNSMRALLNG